MLFSLIQIAFGDIKVLIVRSERAPQPSTARTPSAFPPAARTVIDTVGAEVIPFPGRAA